MLADQVVSTKVPACKRGEMRILGDRTSAEMASPWSGLINTKRSSLTLGGALSSSPCLLLRSPKCTRDVLRGLVLPTSFSLLLRHLSPPAPPTTAHGQREAQVDLVTSAHAPGLISSKARSARGCWPSPPDPSSRDELSSSSPASSPSGSSAQYA